MVKNVYQKGLGDDEESLAVKHLETLGYIILERNFRNSLDEIDILAE
jgi:Holliday junction resolvase-like predicted endonuclease